MSSTLVMPPPVPATGFVATIDGSMASKFVPPPSSVNSRPLPATRIVLFDPPMPPPPMMPMSARRPPPGRFVIESVMSLTLNCVSSTSPVVLPLMMRKG